MTYNFFCLDSLYLGIIVQLSLCSYVNTLIFDCIVCITGIQLSIEGSVHLKMATDIDFTRLISFEDIKAAAADVDMVHQLEEVLMEWCKQIEVSCYI